MTPEQEIACLQKNIEIMESNQETEIKIAYETGREEERAAVIDFIGRDSFNAPLRKRLATQIEAKAHMRQPNRK